MRVPRSPVRARLNRSLGGDSCFGIGVEVSLMHTHPFCPPLVNTDLFVFFRVK